MVISATYLFPLSILPDVIEIYFTKHSDRREATFYSIFSFVEKIGVALSFLISSLALGFSGYTNTQTGSEDSQPDSTIFALRILVSFAPLSLSLLSIIFGCLYYIIIEKRGSKKYSLLSNSISYSDLEEQN